MPTNFGKETTLLYQEVSQNSLVNFVLEIFNLELNLIGQFLGNQQIWTDMIQIPDMRGNFAMHQAAIKAILPAVAAMVPTCCATQNG